MKIQMTVDADVVRQQNKAVMLQYFRSAARGPLTPQELAAAVEQSRGIGDVLRAGMVTASKLANSGTSVTRIQAGYITARGAFEWIAHDATDDSVCPVPDDVKEIKVAFRNGSVSQWSCFRSPQEWRRNRLVAGAAAKPGEWDITAWHVVYLDANKLACG